MASARKRTRTAKHRIYRGVLTDVVGLLESARHAAARSINAVMTAAYWEIGRRIIESEQQGETQADYGALLIARLATDLTARFGRGFSKSNLYQMRAFYLAYRQIFQTASGKLACSENDGEIFQTVSGKSGAGSRDGESALVISSRELENFLLELGSDFAFIGRQKRLRIGNEWFRIDLLFFHRRLKSLMLIDLKLDKFTHADAGQMHLYLNYARKHWVNEDENPPVGVILCTQKDDAVAHYALDGLKNKILAAEYRTALPKEKTLVAELKRQRRLFETRLAIK